MLTFGLLTVTLASAHATPDASSVCQGDQGSVLALSFSADATGGWTSTRAARGDTVSVVVVTDRNPSRACNTLTFALLDDNGTDARFTLSAAAQGHAEVSRGDFTQTWSVQLPDDLPVGQFTLAYGAEADNGGNSAPLFVTFEPGDADPTWTGAGLMALDLADGSALSFSVDPDAAEVELALTDALYDATLEERQDPGAVAARIISWTANERVLWGRWDGRYTDGAALSELISAGVALGWSEGSRQGGTRPWEWTDSTSILASWTGRSGSRVKYGQCWVFAGVTTTLARGVGVPTRAVTNIDAAHERSSTGLVSGPGYAPTGPGSWHKGSGDVDSIWNFHVWNELYLVGNGGWNAVDATCQESSAGRAAPVPVSDVLGGWVNTDEAGFARGDGGGSFSLSPSVGTRLGVVFTGNGPVFARGNPEG